MARIPMGDFGGVVARPAPQVAADPNAYGAGVGRALEGAGQVGMRMAERQGQEDDQRAQQLDAHKRAAAQEMTAVARAAAAESRRVKALTAQAQVSNALADLHGEIETGLAEGAVDKTKAGEIFATRSAKIIEDGTKDVDPQHQELVRATLLPEVGRGRQAVGKLVIQRERQDILAGGMAYFEEMQRFAGRGAQQADQAIANVKAFWSATGPQAGENPAQAAARVQQFAERVRFQQATALVNADPGAAMKALKDPSYLPELDPGQRTSLIQTADVRLTQAINRAEVQAAANERRLKREWDAVSTVLDAGKALEPAYAAEVLQKFKGTAYEGALRQVMAAGPANAAFAGQPLPMQQRALEELQGRMNREGATPADIDAYQKAERAHKAAIADIKADPYQAAAERGVIREIAPLSLDIAQLPQQLGRRSQDAAVVSQWTGQEVSLLRPHEAAKVGEVLSAMPPKDRAGAIAGMAKVMTPGQMRAFAQQLGAKDDTLAAAAILSAQNARTTAGRLVSEIVLTGADAVRENRIKWPQPQVEVRQEIDELTRGAFLSEAAQRAAGDAALAVYAGLVAEGKSPSVREAVNFATGGIMEVGGQKVIKPYGWTDGMVKKALRDVDAPRIQELTGGQPARWGDKELTPEDLARLMPGAQLGPSSRPGAYTVSIGGRMVMAGGRPLVLPLAEAR